MMHSETWLTRYAPAFAIFHAGLFMVAAQFAVTILIGGSPMTPEIYGPAVYAVPAWVWAAAQMGGEALCVAGAVMRGRTGGALLLAGAAMVLPFYAFLGAVASFAGQGVIVTAACLWLTAPGAVLSMIAGWGSMRCKTTI